MRHPFTFLILSFLLLGLDFQGFLGPIKARVEKGSRPIKQGLYRQFSIFNFQFSNLRASREEIMELKKKTEELEREVAKLKIENRDLKIENSNSRRLLGAPLPPEWRFLPAHPFGRKRYLLIDKGKQDGVKKGMVVVFENVLVGKVVEVSEKSAKIILPTDPDSKIEVKIGQVKGVLLGGPEGLILTEILQGRKIEIDDLVVTSGENEVFPPNLLIGKIKKIEKDEREVFQKGLVEPLVDYDRLETVFLIIE